MTEVLIADVERFDGSRSDLLIRDGVFADPASAGAGVERVDGAGLVALPGLVDLHTHLREPGREDAETIDTGTRAAARGGYTAVFAMANTTPVTDTGEAVTTMRAIAERTAHAEVVPVGAISKGLAGEELAELGLMHRAGVTFFSDDGHCVNDGRLMRRAFEYAKAFDGVLAQHAQDGQLAGPGACCHEGPVSGRLGLGGWPAAAEATIVARDIELAALTGGRLHVCHVSTVESVNLIRAAKQRGVQVTCEVTPHHLLFDVERLTSYDPVWKVNPPLRSAEHRAALLEGLLDGTIDCVATDHAPHARQDKEHAFADAAFGMLGLESALGVIVDLLVSPGHWSWADVAERMSFTPARIGQLDGQGQGFEIGAPANLCLIDPQRRTVVDRTASASKSRNNPYHGENLPDPVEMTVWRGKVTWRR